MIDQLKAGLAAVRAALQQPTVRHYGGFVLGGGLAFITDATLLTILVRVFSVSPFVARLFTISIAMVVSWLVNRTITFAETRPPSVAEYLRFAAVSWSAQVVNYCVFAAVLLAMPGLEPIVALIMACLVSMFFSYNGYRLGVFKSPKH